MVSHNIPDRVFNFIKMTQSEFFEIALNKVLKTEILDIWNYILIEPV